jgi:hypothetical protein
LFRETAPPALLPGMPAESGRSTPIDAKAREALAHYQKAIERLKDGDWAGFGAEFGELGAILEELAGRR